MHLSVCTSGAPLWRRACASLTCRLQRRIALARFGVAHMRRAHTRHWRLWLARALAPCSSAAPHCAGSRSVSSTRFARLRRRASRGVDSASALRLACGAPRGRPPGPRRLCTARGRRFGGAPLAPRLAACGMSLSRPPRRRHLRRREQFFFSAAGGGGKKESLISLCFT